MLQKTSLGRICCWVWWLLTQWCARWTLSDLYFRLPTSAVFLASHSFGGYSYVTPYLRLLLSVHALQTAIVLAGLLTKFSNTLTTNQEREKKLVLWGWCDGFSLKISWNMKFVIYKFAINFPQKFYSTKINFNYNKYWSKRTTSTTWNLHANFIHI